MKLVFDEDKLTLGDLADIEEGRSTAKTIRFLVKFTANDDETPADPKEAYKWIAGFTIAQGREAMDKFWDWTRTLRASAVNPPTAAG